MSLLAIARRVGLPFVAVALGAALASFGPGCAGQGAQGSGFTEYDGGEDGGGETDATTGVPSDATMPLLGSSDVVSVGTLLIQSADATIDVTIADGKLTSGPIAFTALADGNKPVTAIWSLDRNDLGTFDAAGALTPSGRGAGVGTISARYGSAIASTTVTLSIKVTQNGGGNVADGGVGGTGSGGPVDTTTQGKLQGPGAPPTSAAELVSSVAVVSPS